MASNSFGNIFRITTWGESHGKAIGVVIDGCPAGLPLHDTLINEELKRRAPGRSPFTSPRNEPDAAEILSGVFEGKTSGAPISIIIYNRDADSTKYESTKNLMKPGHANYTYLEKYGLFDWRGGGRSSARETACRVAAGAVAKELLRHYKIEIAACVVQIGPLCCTSGSCDILKIREKTALSPLFCPDEKASKEMTLLLEAARKDGDSLGGVVQFYTSPLPVGLGDPVYEKLEANLAKAMLSLPATKGFEIGEGFSSAAMMGSEHNDPFVRKGDSLSFGSNHSGGTLGGISSGQALTGKVAFKPASSIKKPQPTIDQDGNEAVFLLPQGSRHDPCVAIRAVPIVESMVALVLADALLMDRNSRL